MLFITDQKKIPVIEQIETSHYPNSYVTFELALDTAGLRATKILVAI